MLIERKKVAGIKRFMQLNVNGSNKRLSRKEKAL
jgi:hypothetical protein